MTQVFKLDIESWYEHLHDVPSPLPTSIPVMKKEVAHNRPPLCERSNNEHSKEHSNSRPRESEERRRIDAFYSSNVCVFCGRVEGGRELICGECVKWAKRGGVRRRQPWMLLATVEGWIRDVETSVSVSAVCGREA